MTGRHRALAALGLGVVASQAGHLLAFELRFGSAAQHMQSTGAHAYFPLFAKTALGVIAAALLAGIFVICLARVLARRSRLGTARHGSFVELLAALFTIQLACFIVQEVGEALVAGVSVDSAAHLLLWGTLGQLPVAAIAAVALRWLWTRFESAVDSLRAVVAGAHEPRFPAPVTVVQRQVPGGALLLAQVVGGSLGKRGPPASLRLST